jgi:hypothetical protein
MCRRCAMDPTATAPRAAAALENACNRPLPVCEPARGQTRTLGLRSNKGRDGKLPVASAHARGADRVHGMDTRWAPTAFELCRLEG